MMAAKMKTAPAAPVDALAALREALAAQAPAVAKTEPEPEAEKPPPKPSLWQHHGLGRIIQPLAWTATADGAAACWHCAVHYAGAGSTAGIIGGGILTLAAAGRTLWVLRRPKENGQKLPLAGSQRRARKRAAAGWIAAAMWAQPAIWATLTGPHGAMQILVVAGGIALGSGHLHASRRQELTWKPVAQLPAAPAPAEDAEDPRLAKFRKRFIDSSGAGSKAQPPLHRAVLEDLAEVDGGFAFTVVTDGDSSANKDTVAGLRPQIAALYDIPADQALFDNAPRRSARRCRVTILTMEDAFAEPCRWDGVSTYDPATGTYRHGRFGDGKAGRWQIHVPGSGMWSGAVYGTMGTGKSFDLHLLAAQAGIVVRCRECGAYRAGESRCDDGKCDWSRLFLLFMGDAQGRAFRPWEGRADLTFIGVLACAFQMRFLFEVMTERDKDAATVTRTDKKGRTREGQGWFDPSPAIPGAVGITDEWSKVVESRFGKDAAASLETVLQEGRKSGVSETVSAQLPDADKTGGTSGVRRLTRDMNIVSHRLDPISKAMTGIRGNAADLPSGEGMEGIGYIGVIDGRDTAPFRTDYLPEDAETGVDVLDMAELISSLPVQIDPAVQRVMDRYGLAHRDVITDEWVADLWQREAEESAPGRAAAGNPAATAPAQAAPAASGPVTLGAMRAAAQAVTACLDEENRVADLYDVMQRTGLSAGAASRALTALESSGEVIQDAGTWRPAGETGHKQALSGA